MLFSVVEVYGVGSVGFDGMMDEGVGGNGSLGCDGLGWTGTER